MTENAIVIGIADRFKKRIEHIINESPEEQYSEVCEVFAEIISDLIVSNSSLMVVDLMPVTKVFTEYRDKYIGLEGEIK